MIEISTKFRVINKLKHVKLLSSRIPSPSNMFLGRNKRVVYKEHNICLKPSNLHGSLVHSQKSQKSITKTTLGNKYLMFKVHGKLFNNLHSSVWICLISSDFGVPLEILHSIKHPFIMLLLSPSRDLICILCIICLLSLVRAVLHSHWNASVKIFPDKKFMLSFLLTVPKGMNKTK